MAITYKQIRDRIESTAKEIIEEETTFPKMPERILFADSARGIYIPQHFAESVNRDLCDCPIADIDELLKGPESESYWDVWTGVLDHCELKDDTGQVWRLHQDGDLWLVPIDAYSAWEAYQQELEALQSEAHDKAHESVDSWDWCIYTYQGFQVYDALSGSEQSDAESAYWDVNSGQDMQDTTPYGLAAEMAYFWLVQEVASDIERQCDELIELAQVQMDNL